MNGVVKTDESDSLAGDMPESAVSKPGQESAVIQPPGVGPAIHLNGSACPVQEDQPVQVRTIFDVVQITQQKIPRQQPHVQYT